MDLFTRDDLRALLADGTTPCVSLYARTTRGAGFEDKVRWRNELREAEERLVANGQRRPDAKDLLNSAHELLNDDPFWLNVSDGLAGFLSPQMTRFYRLPRPFQDEVIVGDRFHLKPLIPLLSGAGRFYVLVLDERNVRLLLGTWNTVQEIDVRAPAQGGRPEGLLHGVTIADDTSRAKLKDYYQLVQRRLQALWQQEQTPLVLAGPREAMEVYRQSNGYAGLLPEGVECSPSMLSEQQLQSRAWELVQKHFQAARARIVNLYRQARGTGQASGNLEEVVPAAYQGQVQYLFTNVRQECWGTFDRERLQVTVHERQEPGDEDLANVAAVHTLSHKGIVYAVEPGEMPEDGLVAAVFWLPVGERSPKRVVATAVSGTGDEARGR